MIILRTKFGTNYEKNSRVVLNLGKQKGNVY